MARPRHRRLVVTALSLVPLVGCSSHGSPPPTVTSKTVASPTMPSPPTAPAPRSVNWFDLDVGDCLADPPPTDPNVVTVAVVDCTTVHWAEVYLRAPLAVNTAVVDVANRTCDNGFTAYTGKPVGSGAYTVTYLIDSNQNRTSSNPEPSTLICLLQAPNGGPLTAPAHR